MNPLARQTGCPVAAFDRPGWGLPSRPPKTEWEEKEMPNPYELQSQVNLLFSFCREIGFSSVVLVGHDDGGLLALMAAERARCSVAAFDRPGWGLTSRPSRTKWEEKEMPNPYELQSQVNLLFSFCREIGFSSVVLVGHDDGGLLALMAAERAHSCREVHQVEVKGVVLVGVSLTRVVLAFAVILLHTSLGQHMLRPLLRTDISQVANRRAWFNATKLTSDVLDLYQRIVPISGCGHLPHEECPKALLAALLPFLSRLFNVSSQLTGTV